MMTALPNKHYSGRCKAMEEEDEQKNIWKRDLERDIWLNFREEDGGGSMDLAGWRQVVCGLYSTGSNMA